MKELLSLIAHLLITIAKLLGPGGAKTIVADSLPHEAADPDYEPCPTART